MLSILLTKPRFQCKVIKFTNYFMYNYNLKVLRKKYQSTNVSPNDKLKFCNSFPLCCIINRRNHAPLWNIPNKKVKKNSTKKEDYEFQVGCVSYLNLEQNKAFKDKFDKCLYSKFYFF